MKELFTQQEYENVKSTAFLPLGCYQCSQTFYREKKYITRVRKEQSNDLKFCGFKCMSDYLSKDKIEVCCTHCNKTFYRCKSWAEKSTNKFCSRSCNALFQNGNKTNGYRRSKLEKFLEEELIKTYPDLVFEFNNKTAIKSELDIFIPSLSLAFELNGIFHYEPIYGSDKLSQIQNNDNRKFQACIENNISLCIIDTSNEKYFKKEKSNKFFTIIKNIIDKKLLTS